VSRLASRKHKESVSASVEVTPIKREYVLSRMSSKSLLIRPSPVLLVLFPEVVGLGSGCIPVIKDLDIYVIFPQPVGEFRDTGVPKAPD
jgi:hypothetical protein